MLVMPGIFRQEVRTLASKDIDGVLLYPGKQVFTWFKSAHMPWVLVSIVPLP
jgi:hypothetical protein